MYKYDVLQVGRLSKLISKCTNGEVKYIVPAEEIFDILEAAHIATGHGGRDRMLSETSKKYANITRETITKFLSMCETCHQKKVKRKRGLVFKPILHKEMNSRCQVDLIDLQSQADNNYKFVMVYQDHLTKFVILRPLSSKRAAEIITELASLWPELKIVHGKPRHSQSQGSVERANQDIENMLAVWMKDNKTTKWAEGLKFIQFMKNRSLHSGTKQAPYKAMFGTDPKVGLSTSKLPSDVIKKIRTEDDLQDVLKSNDVDENDDASGSSSSDDSIDRRQEEIMSARQEAAERLERQAKKMKTVSDKHHEAIEVGDNIIIPIPDVDKAKSDLRNVVGVVLEIEHDLFKVGTRHGIINRLYSRSEFEKCKTNFIDKEEVLHNESISLSSVATQQSNTSGQGYLRCISQNAWSSGFAGNRYTHE
ncbi:KRAB-A domain-containing protein 2-like [Leptopilina heterotoma]|uniref:KRAB-A domain-containing protein 2-like n=1 Tax=Leptopilina heterotoma TaxID=63436 RepID=UPI001CAA3055|nr:KRAB-A domain-containing protein 2-like [Leptopilina heterotoma]